MLAKLLFGKAVPIRTDLIDSSGEQVIIFAHSKSKNACCPECGRKSRRVHSRYVRTIKDLPMLGKQVVFKLRMKRFTCSNEECRRLTFAESIPIFAGARMRCTRRLFLAQQRIAIALGGEAGKRLSLHLGIIVSGDTLLRRLEALACKTCNHVRVIGVDDWALRKGQRYGTLICDLENKCPIAILPTRSTLEFANWLKDHPEIEIISRDRAGEYAKGAQMGAPQALQVADRWHLLRNAGEVLAKTIEANFPLIREHLQVTDSVELTPEPSKRLVELGSVQAETLVRKNENPASDSDNSETSPRRLRYEQVSRLREEGKSMREISRITHMNRNTVRRYYYSTTFPERRTVARKCRIYPFVSTLKELWMKGFQTARSIHAKLKDLGFQGSYYMVVRYLRKHKAELGPNLRSEQKGIKIPSFREIVLLLCRSKQELSVGEATMVNKIIATNQDVRNTTNTLQEFCGIVRDHDAVRWDGWIKAMLQRTLPPFLSRFIVSLQHDAEAIRAALTLPWSNGQLEGQINKLKMIKRQMYGRANLKLLEHRLLPAT